jgi:PAS domain S-box-containing protein
MTLPVATLILQLVQNASMYALVVVGYAFIRRRQHHPLGSQLSLGLLFGLGSLLAMSLSIDVTPDIQVSTRSIPIALAGIIAGPLSAGVTVAMAVAYRLWEGGNNALVGTLGIVATGAIGVLASRVATRFKIGRLALVLAVAGLASLTVGFLLFITLGHTSIATAIKLVLPLYLVVPPGMMIVGLALKKEDERLALQAKLRAQTSLFEAIFNSMSDGVTVANEKGEIVMVNPASVAMAGVQPTNISSSASAVQLGVFEPDGKTPFPVDAMPLIRAGRGEATNNIEMIVHNQDNGHRRLLSVNGRPLVAQDGSRHGAVVVFRDTTEQKELQEALRHSEERFAMAIAGSKDGIFDYNPVTREVWFSPRYKEILGYTVEEFPDDIAFWKARMLPEDHAAATAQFHEYEEGRCSDLHIVQRFRHKQGHIVHVSSRAQGIRGDDGKVARLVGAATDITPLIQSEQRLKDAISVMEDGFGLFDAEDRLILFNEPFMDEGTRKVIGDDPTGCKFEEIVRAFAYNDLPVGDATFDYETWITARMERHRNPPPEPIEVPWSGGRWMRISERRTSDGGYVGIWTDITALKAAKARLRDAIESINEGFALFDAELRFVTFNQRLLDLYPISAPAIARGAKLEDILRYGAQHGEYPELATPNQIDAFVEGWMQRFRAAESFVGEGRFADGRWVLASHRRTSDGGFVSVRTDITAQKMKELDLELARVQFERQAEQLVALAETLQEARVEATQANQEKSRFLASMSHELRTPLNAILGFSDLIRNQIYGPLEPPRYREYVGMIHDSGSHLLSLINDVLDLSKIEAGKMELKISELDSRDLLNHASSLMSNMASQRGLTFQTTVAVDCPTIHADERGAKQIIFNLVSNAIKFSPEGGRIKISIENAGGVPRIVVVDTGIGMSAEEVARALQPYGQVQSDLAVKVAGTGLGLPLVRALAELHGGELDVKSEKGRGTAVSVTFPWHDELPGRGASARQMAGALH